VSARAWILVAVLVAALALGGGAAVVISRAELARVLREAFARYKLPAAWGEALGRVESNLTMAAKVLTGSDGARGGAWGPTQITERTARAHGYTGPMDALTEDPALAAEWTARIAAAGRPATIEDLGAWWNAGRTTFGALPADHVTRTNYVPRLVAALGKATS
jgi:hypothetical protein